jgi:transcription antitermination factor NusG
MTYRKGGKLLTVHLMEGYCFLASGLAEVKYFALERLPYVNSVMSVQGGPHRMRVLSVLPNREIESLRKKLTQQLAADIEEESWVRVVRGKFRGLEGKVLWLYGEQHAYVAFQLRSLHRVSPIPRVFLETIDPPDENVAVSG